MVASFGHISFGSLLVYCDVFAVACGDARTQTSSASQAIASLPAGLDSSLVATLTERVESENFVFHYQPGDDKTGHLLCLRRRSTRYHNSRIRKGVRGQRSGS